MDSITLHPIDINTIIGVLPHERLTPQLVRLTLTLHLDLTLPGQTDSIDHTVDYARVIDCVTATCLGTSFLLIEKLADHLATTLLSQFALLHSVSIGLEKPEAFNRAPTVRLQITRHKLVA